MTGHIEIEYRSYNAESLAKLRGIIEIAGTMLMGAYLAAMTTLLFGSDKYAMSSLVASVVIPMIYLLMYMAASYILRSALALLHNSFHLVRSGVDLVTQEGPKEEVNLIISGVYSSYMDMMLLYRVLKNPMMNSNKARSQITEEFVEYITTINEEMKKKGA